MRAFSVLLVGVLAAGLAGAAELPEESAAPANARPPIDVLGSGRLLATGGATQLEGAAGGGLVPWGVLSGYGSGEQVGGSLFYTRVGVDDFALDVAGVSLSIANRVELSVAGQRFDVEPLDEVLSQLIVGAKVRLFGDLVYTAWPTVALGVQYKRHLDFEIPEALGARDRDGVDVYLAGSKLFLEGLFGIPVLLNGTVRATRANQLGLLGFGGDRNGSYQAVFEGSAALLLQKRLAVGYEYRQKPDQLRSVGEDAWQDLFVALFLDKRVALVAGYARLGEVALWSRQDGYYLSLQASY